METKHNSQKLERSLDAAITGASAMNSDLVEWKHSFYYSDEKGVRVNCELRLSADHLARG